MFKKEIIVLHVSEKKLKVTHVIKNSEIKINSVQEYTWSQETLEELLYKIKQMYGDRRVRILLDECFTYTVVFGLTDKLISRDIVQVRAQEDIPEQLNETIWDYREEMIVKEREQTQRIVQVTAANKKLIDPFLTVVNKVGFLLEIVVPVSAVFSHYFREQQKPMIFIYPSEKVLIIVTYLGLIISTQTFQTFPDEAEIIRTVNYIRLQYEIEVSQILLNSGGEKLIFQSEVLKRIPSTNLILDPVILIALFTHKEMTDILQIPIITTKRLAIFSANYFRKISSSRKIIVFAIISLVLLLIGVGAKIYHLTK